MAKLKISAGNHVHGKVSLDGGSLTAIFALSYVLANFTSGKVTNVPRSKEFLDFVDLLLIKKVDISWDDEKTIRIRNTSITKEFALFDSKVNDKYALLLAAVLISKQQSCVLTSRQREIAKFYRKIGFKVDSLSKNIVVRCDRATSKPNLMDLKTASYYKQMAAYLIHKTFSDLIIRYDDNFTSKIGFLENLDTDTQKIEIKNPFSAVEFNVFVTLGATSITGLEIEGFDQKESLDRLIFFDKTCADYEVKERLKIWYSFANVKNLYDFSNVSANDLAYYLFILSVYIRTSCKVVVKNTTVLQKIVKELNIIGCKINVEVGKERDYIEIIVNNAEISMVGVTLCDAQWSGVLLVAAIICGGKVEVDSIEFLENVIPNLREKLSSVGVETL